MKKEYCQCEVVLNIKPMSVIYCTSITPLIHKGCGKEINISGTNDTALVLHKSYPMHANCLNCGDSKDVRIPAGTTAREFQKDYLCQTCNCGNVDIRPIMRFR